VDYGQAFMRERPFEKQLGGEDASGKEQTMAGEVSRDCVGQALFEAQEKI
jgi:hypothetical protein